MLLLRFPHQFEKNEKVNLCHFFKIQNPGQITRPSIDTTAVLKGKSDKYFKKVVPIRGNHPIIHIYCKLQVLRCNLPKNTSLLMRVIFSKIQNPGQITRPSIDMMAVLKGKSDKDFEKVVPICNIPSYNSQRLLFWCNLMQKMSANLKYYFFSVKLMWKSPKQHWNVLQSSVRISNNCFANMY